MRVLIAFGLLLVLPGVAMAQLTLVIRDQPRAHPGIETAVEDALRESVGGSVRRIDSTLDDLALAAGCPSDAGPTAAECIASLARAGDARLVAIEHLVREGPEWSVRIDLRRADGTHVSTLVARCEDASCAGEATEVAEPTHDTDATTSGASTQPAHETVAAPTRHEPAPRSFALLPHALFVASLLVGIGSFVAGGVSLSSANEATALGTAHTPEQTDRQRALEDQASVSFAVGIALAACGAGLAIAGAFTLTDDGPRIRIGLSGAQLSVSF